MQPSLLHAAALPDRYVCLSLIEHPPGWDSSVVWVFLVCLRVLGACAQAPFLGEFQRMVELQESTRILADLANPGSAESHHNELRVALNPVSCSLKSLPRCDKTSGGHCSMPHDKHAPEAAERTMRNAHGQAVGLQTKSRELGHTSVS